MATQVGLEPRGAVLDVIHRRRAIRSYQPTALPETIIRTLLDAAVQAPTGMHTEPWTFVVIQDRAKLKSLSDRAKVLARAEAGRKRAPETFLPDHLLELLTSPEFNIFYDAGTLIVICGKPMGQFVMADCWLAAENLMLAACSMGLGTCCIGLAVPVLNTAEVKRELSIPAGVTAVAPIIVGVPRSAVPAVQRKPPEVLSWIR